MTMRVLWLTVIQPSPVRRALGLGELHGPTSWVEALRRGIASSLDVDLAMASLGEVSYVSFLEDCVTFFNISVAPLAETRVERVAQNWLAVVRERLVSAAVRAVIQDFQTDLIHVHGTESGVAQAWMGAEVPTVISLQGLTIVCRRFYSHGLSHREVLGLTVSREFLRGTSELHGYLKMGADHRRFLNLVNRSVPDDLEVHVIVDNSSTHKTPAIRRWVLRHPRFTLYFTPTYSSWLGLVERWFAELTATWLRRGNHRSTKELVASIRTWITDWNENPRPFVWHKTSDEILESLAA